ncbi:MAG: SHOCT domain-containing protein [Clostridia bacterium]|nr:SHOCT domain-containing protein [Clostridia bacterium]MDR3645767.1 SHOCT domain-containing protein [Clostridia bacterium]
MECVFLFFATLLVIALIVIAILAIIRFVSRRHPYAPPREAQPPRPDLGRLMAIVSERYAKGEINSEEFQKMKDELLRQ